MTKHYFDADALIAEAQAIVDAENKAAENQPFQHLVAVRWDKDEPRALFGFPTYKDMCEFILEVPLYSFHILTKAQVAEYYATNTEA